MLYILLYIVKRSIVSIAVSAAGQQVSILGRNVHMSRLTS